MNGQTIPASIAATVVKNDQESLRFERFCVALVNEIEPNKEVVRTSPSWDLGRDGRSIRGKERLYLCCTLTDQLEGKVDSDLVRLSSTTKQLDILYYCCSLPLTEQRQGLLEAEIRKLIPAASSIHFISNYQLGELAERYPTVITKFYSAELQAIRLFMADASGEHGADDEGLRLALYAFGSESSSVLRSELYKSLLLSLLADGVGRTVTRCCKEAGEKLRLPRSLPEPPVRHFFQVLEAEGLVQCNSAGVCEIRNEGVAALQKLNIEAASDLLHGKNLIRARLEKLLGYSLAPTMVDKIWSLLQDRISEMFFTRGIQMVSSLAALVGSDENLVPNSTDNADYKEMVAALARAVSNLSSNEQQRTELETAINDMFHEPTTEVFSWLLGVCFAFVGLCSLGLEHTCAVELKRLLARLDMVLDTDVALSLLCEGEPDHGGVLTLVKRWTAMGAKIFIAEPVLHEMAHHAWIAQRDLDPNAGWLPGTEDDRLRLLSNAFARAFATLMATKGARLNQWGRYISTYRGAKDNDSGAIFSILHSDFGIDLLPPPTLDEQIVERDVRTHLSKIAQKAVSHPDQSFSLEIALDKASRDARLYATLLRHHKALISLGQGRATLLISSARRLLAIHEKVGAILEKELVIPLSVALYLLTLVPDVSVGLGALRSYLFERQQFGLGNVLDRAAMRVIREAQILDVPWAKRTVVAREIRDRIFKDARARGLRHETRGDQIAVENAAFRPENAAQTAKFIVEAVNSAGIDTRLETENRELRVRVRALEEVLARQKDKPTTRHGEPKAKSSPRRMR